MIMKRDFLEQWSYTNDGFEPEEVPKPTSLVRKLSLKLESPEQIDKLPYHRGPSPPSQIQRRRTVSRSESDTSNNLPGQYTTPIPKQDYYPIIPKEDYPIPRAELDDNRPKRRSQSDMSDGFDIGTEYVQKVTYKS